MSHLEPKQHKESREMLSHVILYITNRSTRVCVFLCTLVCVCVVSLRVKENILYVQLRSNVCTILFVFEDLLGPMS